MIRIGLDIDGVLAEFDQHFLKWLGLPTHRATHWEDPRFVDNFHKIESDRLFWLTVPPLPEAINALIDRGGGIDRTFFRGECGGYPWKPVVYITARPIGSYITEMWLRKHRFPIAPVVTVGKDGSKVEAIKEYRVELFLDDSIRNFEEINDSGTTCLLVSRNHNLKHKAGDLRVDNLLHFCETKSKLTYENIL